MIKNSLIATLLIAVPLAALGFELKTGLWQITRAMENGQLREESRSAQHCLTEGVVTNPEATYREDLSYAGFTDINFTQVSDTINVSGVSALDDPTDTIDMTIKKHSDEFTSSRTEEVRDGETFVIIQESRWISEDC